MDPVAKGFATQLANIEKKTGKSLAELVKFVKASGLVKHGEIRDMLKNKLKLGHGDANTLTHVALDPTRVPGTAPAAAKDDGDDPATAFYTGPKAALKPIHDKLNEIEKFASESLPRRPTSVCAARSNCDDRPRDEHEVEVGLNVKGLNLPVALPAREEYVHQGPCRRCRGGGYELIGWLRSVRRGDKCRSRLLDPATLP